MKLEIQLVSRKEIKNIPSFARSPRAKALRRRTRTRTRRMPCDGLGERWARSVRQRGQHASIPVRNGAVSRAHQSAPFCAASPMRKPGGMVSARGVAVGEGAGAVLAGKVDRRTHAARALVHRRVVRSLVDDCPRVVRRAVLRSLGECVPLQRLPRRRRGGHATIVRRRGSPRCPWSAVAIAAASWVMAIAR